MLKSAFGTTLESTGTSLLLGRPGKADPFTPKPREGTTVFIGIRSMHGAEPQRNLIFAGETELRAIEHFRASPLHSFH